MKKSHKRPTVNATGEPHSSALYKAKKPLLNRKQSALLFISATLLLLITGFTIWVLNERHKAIKKAREVNFNFARVLKEKAKIHAENQQWQLVKLFVVNSMLYQAKTQQFISMKDIEFPLEFQHSQLDYLTYVFRNHFSVEEISQLLKETEQQTGLVLDGTTPVSTDIYYSLDLNYYKNSKYNSAIEAYNAANDLYHSGSNHLHRQRYHEAISDFIESLKIRPRFKEALNKLGWVYQLIGEKRKAKRLYKKAKELDLDYYIKWNSEQWADLGNRQKMNRDYTNAIQSYKEALQINPHYYRAWDRLGQTYEDENQFDKAIDVYNQAIQALPLLSREWKSKISYNLALKHHREGQYNQAINAFKQSIQFYPKLDRAWIKLADAYQKKQGKKVIYRGEPLDLYFDNTGLRLVLIFIARQTNTNLVISPGVNGKISCELDQVKWDKALDLFLKINDCDKYSEGNILIIGKTRFIEEFLEKKKESNYDNQDIKKFSGKPLDLSFFGADIHFVLQTMAVAANLKIIVDPGINHDITCELYQVPWDMALDVFLQMNDLSSFVFSNLIRIGRKAVIKKMCESEEGILEILQSLLKLDPGQVNFKDNRGKTLLFFAAEKGYPGLAKFLVSLGAKVNDRDNWNFTPLHDAANKEVAEVLINSGAFLNVKSNSGLTPLQTAVYGLKTDVARFLVSKGAASDIYLDASMGRIEKVRQRVLKNPGIVNNAGMGGWTLLHHATVGGQYEIAAFLISKNANVNAETIKGETPLHLAVSRGRKKIVKLLILNGADVNARNKYGDTPLHIAETNGDREVIELLEKYGGRDY